MTEVVEALHQHSGVAVLVVVDGVDFARRSAVQNQERAGRFAERKQLFVGQHVGQDQRFRLPEGFLIEAAPGVRREGEGVLVPLFPQNGNHRFNDGHGGTVTEAEVRGAEETGDRTVDIGPECFENHVRLIPRPLCTGEDFPPQLRIDREIFGIIVQNPADRRRGGVAFFGYFFECHV